MPRPSIAQRWRAAVKAWNMGLWDERHWLTLVGSGSDNLLPGTSTDWEREAGDLWRSSTVAVALGWLTTAYAEPRLEVLNPPGADGVREPVAEHRMLEVVRRPTAFQAGDEEWSVYSGSDLWVATLLSFVTDGNAYWLKVRNGASEVVQLWYLPHWTVEPAGQKDAKFGDAGYLAGYFYKPDLSKKAVLLKRSDVVHFRYGVDPRNPRKGLAPLKMGVRAVVGDNEGETYVVSLLKNCGVIPGMLVPRGDNIEVTEPISEDVKNKFVRATTGDERGKPLVPTVPLDWQQVGLSPEAMNISSLRSMPQGVILSLLRVPALLTSLLVGQAEKTYANYLEARRMLIADTIKPLQAMHADTLDIHLLPEFEEDKRFEVGWNYDDIEILKPDRSQERKDAVLLYQGGVAKLGQAQELANVQPDEENSDLYVWEAQAKAQPAMPGLPDRTREPD